MRNIERTGYDVAENDDSILAIDEVSLANVQFTEEIPAVGIVELTPFPDISELTLPLPEKCIPIPAVATLVDTVVEEPEIIDESFWETNGEPRLPHFVDAEDFQDSASLTPEELRDIKNLVVPTISTMPIVTHGAPTELSQPFKVQTYQKPFGQETVDAVRETLHWLTGR